MDKIKVLLAEDHVIVREGTRQLIQHETDMEVIGEASDGEEAIELADKLHPVIACDKSRFRLLQILAQRVLELQ